MNTTFVSKQPRVDSIMNYMLMKERELLQLDNFMHTSMVDNDIQQLIYEEKIKLAIGILEIKKELNICF
ncbi:hypothetical protein [Aquimarina brevivitae]|uniref:Uncharacterized protein n=1 Tax=Aquimarina brevivitae TaxID=323412 RepID=A0A4Q7PJ13_9FLAO|nr:hypothetical protein [Aquimarina brevivitae]RZT00268.1 hypothetical protein EV197_1504 [Aquimarina brevivitae]